METKKGRKTIFIIVLMTIACALSALSANAQEEDPYIRENNAPARAPENIFSEKKMISDDVYSADKNWWDDCTFMEAYKNPKVITIKGKNAIHKVDISLLWGEHKIYKLRILSAKHQIREQIFKANFAAKVKSKEDIDFLRKLGEEGYSYTVRLYSGKESFDYVFKPEELKKFFQWNQ